MTYRLSQKSLSRLEGVHPHLVKVIKRAIEITEVDFTVLEGLRTVARQRQLVRQGSSWTMNSRHITGHAVDIAPYVEGGISWHWPHYHKLAPFVWQAAEDVGIPVDRTDNKGALEWGGLWRKTPDGPHWQLSWDHYPKDR